MTRVLITGTGGFVGSHVAEVVLDTTDWDVVCVDSFRHNGTVDRTLDAISRGNRVIPITHDLTVPFSRSQVAVIGDVDLIVNVASRCHVGESIDRPVEFVMNNVALVLNVLELARELRPQQLVHMSTDEVYGQNEPVSSHEHTPSNPYSASKAAQTDICYAYRRTYGVPVTVLSSANMFGERQSQLAFVPRIMRAVTRGEYVHIHCYRGSPGTRHYTYVRNVAEQIVDYLRVGSSPLPNHVTLRGQRCVDNLKMAQRVAELMGREFHYVMVNAEQVRPGYDPSYADLTKFKWEPRVSFDEGLKRTVTWALRNLHALEA